MYWLHSGFPASNSKMTITLPGNSRTCICHVTCQSQRFSPRDSPPPDNSLWRGHGVRNVEKTSIPYPVKSGWRYPPTLPAKSTKVTLVYEIKYLQTSNIRRIVVGNNIVDHSDVVGASPIGSALATSSFSTYHTASEDWAKTRWETFKFWDLVRLILEVGQYIDCIVSWYTKHIVSACHIYSLESNSYNLCITLLLDVHSKSYIIVDSP